MKSPVFILYVTLLGRALGLTIFGDWIEGKGDKSHGHGSSETSSMSAKAVDIYSKGLSRAQKHAQTDECKALIEEEYIEMLDRVANERPMPFEDKFFYSQCPSQYKRNTPAPLLPIYMKKMPPKPELPPAPEKPRTHVSAENLRICYMILMHEDADQVMRLIKSLDELSPSHSFVVHVDLKSPQVYERMLLQVSDYNKKQHIAGAGHRKVHILEEGRQRINWGGYSMVNATLQCMRYALNPAHELVFDYLVLLSGSTYPIQSNHHIRHFLSGGSSKMSGNSSQNDYKIYSDINPVPSRPPADMWHTYVECDDHIHRIGRLATVRGMNMYTGGQWFAIPRHVGEWVVTNPLPREYTEYAKYVVVADENYFSTLFRNSPYCEDIVSQALTFYVFDKWENEKESFNSTSTSAASVSSFEASEMEHSSSGPGTEGEAETEINGVNDEAVASTVSDTMHFIANSTNYQRQKCLSPMPTLCGRSPDTLTMKYRRLLQVSEKLFARKINPSEASSVELMKHIDNWRSSTLVNRDPFHSHSMMGFLSKSDHEVQQLEGHDANKISKNTTEVSTDVLARRSIMIRQRRSFASDLGKALDKDRENELIADLCVTLVSKKGESVILRPCNHKDPDQWFLLGPCSGSRPIVLSDVDDVCTHTYVEEANANKEDTVCQVHTDEDEDFYCQIQRHPSPSTLMSLYGVQITETQTLTVPNERTHTSARSGESTMCLDISGENPYEHAILVGWPCKASWNQLFRFNGDCSLSAMQPEAIGRIRGTTSSDIMRKRKLGSGRRRRKFSITKEKKEAVLTPENGNHIVCVQAVAHRMPEKISVQLHSEGCANTQSIAPFPINTSTIPVIDEAEQRFEPLSAAGERWKQYNRV